MVVARRAPPIDILRGFARDKAPILPKIFAGPGSAAPMQAMNDSRCDTACFQDQTGHCVGDLAGANRRLPYCPGFAVVHFCLRHRAYPMRAFSRRMTLGMVSPSARAAKVGAIRCLSTGSACSRT